MKRMISAYWFSRVTVAFLSIGAMVMPGIVEAEEDVASPPTTKVVVLGTGTPIPDPAHSGCSVAVFVGSQPYIVDFGPGVVRQLAALTPKYGGDFEGLKVESATRAFLTHMHSDHTTGYPDLIFTPWVMGRNAPLQVYGPEGIVAMTDHILAAYRQDISYRLYGLEPANNQGWRVEAHEISEGLVYEDELVTVEAFPVDHGSWPNAFGFRFTTASRVVVISGDTRPCEKLVEYAQDADVLIHEVYSAHELAKRTEIWQKYHTRNHTSTRDLGELATRTRPGLLVIYHTLDWGASENDLLAEIAETYNGDVVVARDLGAY